MPDMLPMAALKLLGLEGRLASVEVAEVAVVVDGTNQEEHLRPAEGRDSGDGGDAVGNVGEGEAWGDLSREAEDLGDDEADDSELGDAAVLELAGAVLGEGLLVNVL